MKKNLLLTSFILGAMLLVMISGVSALSISTDKDDYEPGEVVLISGEGFNPHAELIVTLVRPDGTIESCDASNCNERFLDGALTSDENGEFSNYQYDLNGILGEYFIEVSDGENAAYIIFTDYCSPTYTVDTYDSGSYSTPKNEFGSGETVYGKGTRTGYSATMRLVFRNPSNVVVHTCSSNYGTQTTCAWGLPSDAPLGEWDIQLQRQYCGLWGCYWDTKKTAHFDVVDNQPPVIDNLQYETYLPCEEDVTVCADVTDESDIDSVSLYCLASNGWSGSGPMDLTTGDEYCGTISAATLHAADGITVDCTITAEDEHENEATSTVPTITYDCADPQGDFVCNPLNGDEPLTTDCDATFTDVSPLTYAWTFTGGDPSSSTNEDPIGIEYAQDGSYTVILTVTDSVGHEIEVIKTDYIEVDDTDPIASFTYTGDLVEGYEIDFFDTSWSYDGIVSWYWNFDDEETSSEKDPSHTFAEDGTYSVSLKVCEGDGDCDTYTEDLEILPIIPLDPEEVAAYYEFGYSFETGLGGSVTCSAFTPLPDGMSLGSSGSNCLVNWVPTNDQQGIYDDIIIKVTGSGPEYYSLDVTVWSWIIDLQEGWNLFSIPYVPEDESIEVVVLNQLYDSLPEEEYVVYSYQFNGEESVWFKSNRDHDGLSDLDTVSPGYAYWVKVDENTKLRGNGKQLRYESPGLPPEVEVETNHWQMVGRYGIIGQFSPPCNPMHGELKKSLALESLGRQDENELHVYEITDNGHMESAFFLENNKGYLLWVENEDDNDIEVESYAPLDHYYREEMMCT